MVIGSLHCPVSGGDYKSWGRRAHPPDFFSPSASKHSHHPVKPFHADSATEKRTPNMSIADHNGTWKQLSAENFIALLDVIGVSDEVRARFKASDAALVTSVAVEGDTVTWSTGTQTGVTISKNTYSWGQEFEEASLDGKRRMTIHTYEGGSKILTVIPNFDGQGTPMNMTREVVDGKKVVIISYKGITANLIYEKI
ncbi:myelin P2 protein-like [Branchiostoma lanceolatum]|uniref:myelin P2 protein-like n=1 Tax=Branchiostoma lanceolatum TaxID=7740 RepID=UPI003451BD41